MLSSRGMVVAVLSFSAFRFSGLLGLGNCEGMLALNSSASLVGLILLTEICYWGWGLLARACFEVTF